jgi:hypothetical protein
MPTPDSIEESAPPLSREDLVALVARAHQGSAYAESAAAGRTLAAQSKLPKTVAENLGAGFGQWDFFPEPAEIVDFALAYAPPSTEGELWAIARAWASDDAAARPTLMTLVGRDIVQHELRRIDVPKLREVIDEVRPSRARELRVSAGLDVPAPAPAKVENKPKKAAAARPAAVRAPVAAAAPPTETLSRMPKPAFRPPPKPAPVAEAKRFQHPKFGEGVLESQDGVGPEAKLTIKFASGSKTLLSRYVTEVPT